jgi:hypothetical protein
MKLSAVRLVAATGLVVSTLAAVALTSASPASADVTIDPRGWCSAPLLAPCIVSMQRGSETPITADNATWQADLHRFNYTDPTYTQLVWSLRKTGSLDVTSSESGVPWTIVIDTGSVIPRVSNAFGRHGSVTRVDDMDGTYHVTITAEPTKVSIEGCDYDPYPWACYATSPNDEWRFGGTIDDWRQWEPVEQRVAFWGVDFFSNVEVTSFPPGVVYDDATGIAAMRLDFAAPHFEENGSTVATGHFEATLPNDFLRENFFIPSPTTMTTSSLLVTGSGGSSTTVLSKPTPESPMHVEVTGMTWPISTISPSPRTSARLGSNDSHIRKLRVKTGIVVPTKPTDLRATRVTSSKAKIGYDLATPRGYKVTGYKARCESPGGHVASATKSTNSSPIYVAGLRSATPYTCKVRALSNAGPGPWSAGVQVARRP